MARVADVDPREFNNPDDIMTHVRELVKVKATTEMLEARQKDLRATIFEHIEANPEYDEKGNMFFELPEEVDGVVRIEKQRRSIRKLDPEVAEEILTELELLDECTVVKREVDEEELMKAHYDGKISEEELEKMYPEKVNWAMRLAKK